jgi:hypothetical protein
MELLKDRRVILVGGAALALAAGLAVAVTIAMHQDDSDGPSPASEGGLMIQTGHVETAKLDPALPLRCFVNGRLVGELPVNDCAHRNGVATGALDVGVDSSGALAAAKTPTPDVAPPPPPPTDDHTGAATGLAAPEAGEGASAAAGGEKTCWGHDAGAWHRQPSDMSLNACVQSLFAGQCVSPGRAVYGRWGERTLRLVLGRVEISGDDGGFRPLVRQQGGCIVPSVQ